MTIVHIDTGLTLRGGQRQLLGLARGLAQRGHAQTIVCPEGSGLEVRASEEGFRVFSLPSHDPGHAHGIYQLRQYILASPAQILHAHDGRGQTLSWLASWGLPVRRVASRRVTFLPRMRYRHRFIYLHTCHAVIAVSSFVRNLLLASNVSRETIEVIPDGIEVPALVASPADCLRVREEWRIGKAEFVVGQIGASTQEKGQEIAAEAMALLAERLPQARLLVLGDTSTDVQNRLLAIAGRVGARVQFLGHREDLTPFFAAIDLLWMPSLMEGLGSAALLAMAHGRPVIASRAGGLPEVVEDGRTGWLVAPGSADDLAQATFLAAGDPARLIQMGTDARERAREFSTDIMVARTEKLYHQLI